MKYAVDKIEDNIVTLENIIDGSKRNILLKDITFNIIEGDILVFNGKKYIKDDNLKNERLKKIQEKMNRLRKDT